MINHGHILVNAKKVNIASFQCKKNDIISINNNYLNKQKINMVNTSTSNQVEPTINLMKYTFTKNLPSHLEMNNFEGKILSTVKSNEILLNIDELKIIEYYSR